LIIYYNINKYINIKMYLNPEEVYKAILKRITSKKPNINEQLSLWLKNCDYNATNISPRDLNYRYYLLSRV